MLKNLRELITAIVYVLVMFEFCLKKTETMFM